MADDFSEVLELSKDLTEAAHSTELNRRVVKALQVTSMDIKQDWQQGAERSGLVAYSRSIDFDINFPNGAIESEIGPNLGKRQGTFGFVEDAPGGVDSAPQHAGRDALEANEPDFERGLEIALYNAVEKAVGG